MSENNTTNYDYDVDVATISDAKRFDFNGILVPYIPSESTTILTAGDNEEVREMPPAYINNLKKYLENESYRSLQNALLSMKKEVCLSIVRQMAFKCHGFEAPIAVSNAVPADHVYVDVKWGRIILNEMQATFRYVDADGDRAVLLFSDDKEQAVLVKFPITMQPLILKVIHVWPADNFEDFTLKDAKKLLHDNPVKRIGVNCDLKEMFKKKHTSVPVGLLTNAWNSYDLYASRHMTWEDKMEYLYNSHIDPLTGKPLRAIEIEDGGMKAVRKEDKTFNQEAEVFNLYAGKVLDHQYAWALTSCSSIGGMKDYQLNWVANSDLHQVVSDCLSLNVEFRDVMQSSKEEAWPIWVEGDPLNPDIEPYHQGIIARLMDLKLLDYVELTDANGYGHERQKKDPNFPPAVMVWLQTPEGRKVALTDVKREGRDVGLTYAFLLSPVFDNRDIMDEEGNVLIPATHTWMHPIQYMAKVFTTFDSTIKHKGEDVYLRSGDMAFFPHCLDNFFDPKMSIKVSQLQNAILEYCGEYGDPAPARKNGNSLVPTSTAFGAIRRTVVVDYGRNMNPEQMLKIAEIANRSCPFNMPGSKSTSKILRKYMLANQYGGMCLDINGLAHPYRCGMGRAQLQRALPGKKYRVAIVKGETLNQVHITPTGIAKQETAEAFLPQVFTTREKYQKHLEAHGWTEDDLPAIQHDYITWRRERRRCWIIDARKAIHIGKLIDQYGNKFMPRYITQVFTAEENIDLVIPYNELVDKDNQHALLQNMEERQILINGKYVTAILIDAFFMRTGSFSENVPARWRYCAYKGLDSYPIWYRYSLIKKGLKRDVNLEFALELQESLNHILHEYGYDEDYSNYDPEFLNS